METVSSGSITLQGIILAFMLVCHSHQSPSSPSDIEVTATGIRPNDDRTTTAEISRNNIGGARVTVAASTATATVTNAAEATVADDITATVVDDTTAAATATAAATTAATIAAATAAAATAVSAVSVRTFLNVSRSSFGPSRVFEDFQPSNYYRPDGNLASGKPDQYGAFHEPRHFKRPHNSVPENNRLTPKPDEKNTMIFPNRQRYSAGGRVKYDDDDNVRQNGPSAEPRSPYVFNEVLPRYKPLKHDSGDHLPPNFVHYDNNLYNRHFGKQYHGNNMVSNNHYSDVTHGGPPISNYHGATVHKKKDPWRSLISVLATILPVGLLLASFPPTVIKVNSTQYPYQFQKNATSNNPINVISGRYKMLGEKNTPKRKINNDIDEFPGYLNDCLKTKICLNMKNNYSPSELDILLKSDKLNWTRDTNHMTEIAEIAAQSSPESCRMQFVCNDLTI